jgi:putative ABC transport system permease protein
MRPLLAQIGAITLMNLKSVPQRLWLSLSTVLAIALVVVVLLTFLAMANGFQRTVKGSGADDVAVILRGGSQSEINSAIAREQVRLIDEAPGIARNAAGEPLTSAELYVVVDGVKRASGTKANVPLRGIGSQGSKASSRGAPSPSGPRAGTWSVCSPQAAACSSLKSGRTCRWCRASSTATTISRPCGRGS